MTGLNAGELDREVTIETLTESQGATGFPVEAWSCLDTVWMSRRDMRGYERFRAGQLSGAAEVIFTLQYREDMDPECIDVVKKRRLTYGGRIYDITGAIQIGRQDGIELTTLAKVG